MPKHTPDRTVVVGVAWFERSQWKRLTEVVENRNELDETYEQWEQGALDAVRMIERQGGMDQPRPNGASLTGAFTSPLRARYGAGKRGRQCA